MNAPEKNQLQLVKVYIRQRPFSKSELELKVASIMHLSTEREISVKSGYQEKKYNFDRVFDEKATQSQVYDVVVSPLIPYVISGYNCTAFAYGQTGTGKTHTIIGGHSLDTSYEENDRSLGIIPRAACHLFSELSKLDVRIEYTVRVSFIEIYNEEVRDLLNGCAPLRVCDDRDNKGSVCMKGLSEVTVCNLKGVYKFLNIGTKERQTASTNLNSRSSRSHTVFTMLVNTREITTEGEELIKTGKLNLVDLAGSENIGRSGATDVRAREAGTINKSLLTLGKVIKALAQKIPHVPYRDSKLTRILQDSLGGNTKTCMIGTISPCANAWEETVSTLEYASAARNVANCPRMNVNRQNANFLKQLQSEITRLRDELMAARSGDGFYITQESYEQMSKVNVQNQERLTELIRQLKDLEDHKRVKEQQLDQLQQSFEETKAYLRAVDQELEKKRLKERENEHILNYMYQREDELTKNANVLLKVCETSTKHEEIFHSKYQHQCNATLNNGRVAKNLATSAAHSLKEIQSSVDSQISRQRNYLNEVMKDAEVLKRSSSEDIIPMEAEKYGMTLDDIFKSAQTTYTEDSIQDRFNSCYDELLHLADSSKINHSLKNLREQTVAKNNEINVKCERSLVSVEDLNRNSEFYVKIKNEFEGIRNDLDENCSAIEKQIREEKILLEKSQLLKQRIGGLLQEVDEYEKHNACSCSKVKETFMDFRDCQAEDFNTKISMIDSLNGAVNTFTSDLICKIVSDQKKATDYLAGFTKTIGDNLNRYNGGLQTMFHNCIKKTVGLKEKVFKTASHTSEMVELMAVSLNTHSSDMKKFIQDSTDRLQDLELNVVLSAHAGDTPVRNSYEYPKSIDRRIPNCRLLEQLNSISAEESEEAQGESGLS